MISTLEKTDWSFLTVTWIVLPFVCSFTGYLFAKFARYLSLVVGVSSLIYSAIAFTKTDSGNIQLLDSFGVTLLVDSLSDFFILTNALVTIAVIVYCWRQGKTSYFYAQMMVLHGSVNATFVCRDLISLYVALEVISIAAFSLITYPRTNKSIWVGLRYLFISNTAMLFYLVGAVLVYKANYSFDYQGLGNAPPEAIALILLGLLVKGGVFISGLWLPLTHSESESPVSAMLSGIVVKASIFPLVRCALLVGEIAPIIQLFGVLATIFGVILAIIQQDTKRTLGFSSVSQLGFILAVPAMGGLYALAHGLAKSALFLVAGNLPSRNFPELKSGRLSTGMWLALLLPSLSIAGCPLLLGFPAKTLVLKNTVLWQEILLTLAAVGTVIVYAKFIFLPNQLWHKNSNPAEIIEPVKPKLKTNLLIALIILLSGILIGNLGYFSIYDLGNITKNILVIAIGCIGYFLVSSPGFNLKSNPAWESLDHLIGNMSLTLVAVFLFLITWVDKLPVNKF